MMKPILPATLAAIASLAGIAGTPAIAAEPITFVLNWFPTADHAPYYYAREQGWYDEVGLEIEIESAKGSGASSQTIGAGRAQLGVADLPTAFIARGKGAELVGVMAIYANSPQGFYWRKSASGIESVKDFPGHSIGNPPGDASRVMWPAFAEAAGIDEDSMTFVNIAPQAKMPTLMAGRVDIISDFYNEHDIKVREIGDDLGYVGWRDIGLNPYGNTVFVNGGYLESNRDQVERFVTVTQRAFAACIENETPCIDALVKSVSGLDKDQQTDQWGRVEELMSAEATRTEGLGYFDPTRLEESYGLVETYFDLEVPFEVEDAYTNEFLDTSIKASE